MRKLFRSRVRRPKKIELYRPRPDGSYVKTVGELVGKALDMTDKTTYLLPAFGYKLESTSYGGKILSCHNVDIMHVDADGTVEECKPDLHVEKPDQIWYLTREGRHIVLNRKTLDYIFSCQDAVVSMAKDHSSMGVV